MVDSGFTPKKSGVRAHTLHTCTSDLESPFKSPQSNFLFSAPAMSPSPLHSGARVYPQHCFHPTSQHSIFNVFPRLARLALNQFTLSWRTRPLDNMAPGNPTNFIFQLPLPPPHSCHSQLGTPLYLLTDGVCPLPRTFLLLYLENPNPRPSVGLKHFLAPAPSANCFHLKPYRLLAPSSHHVGKSHM